jgi:hypothetical protein
VQSQKLRSRRIRREEVCFQRPETEERNQMRSTCWIVYRCIGLRMSYSVFLFLTNTKLYSACEPDWLAPLLREGDMIALARGVPLA